jgi:hypothetical protein
MRSTHVLEMTHTESHEASTWAPFACPPSPSAPAERPTPTGACAQAPRTRAARPPAGHLLPRCRCSRDAARRHRRRAPSSPDISHRARESLTDPSPSRVGGARTLPVARGALAIPRVRPFVGAVASPRATPSSRAHAPCAAPPCGPSAARLSPVLDGPEFQSATRGRTRRFGRDGGQHFSRDGGGDARLPLECRSPLLQVARSGSCG